MRAASNTCAAIDDSQRVIHAQAQPLEDGGEVPGIDAVAVHRGLAADRLEPRPMQKRRQQGMIVERLVEPGDGARRALDALANKRRVGR